MAELQPSKLNVASSILVSRSNHKDLFEVYLWRRIYTSCHLFGGCNCKAHVAQSVERFLGKEEVHRFNSGRGLHFFIFAGNDLNTEEIF